MFSPICRPSFPLLETEAPLSLAGALTVSRSTSAGTVTEYSVVSGEKAGLNSPGDTVREDKDASSEYVSGALTVTAELPTWLKETVWESAS